VLAVNSTIQDTAADAQTFARGLGLTFPILLDVAGLTGDRYQLRALPSTFFIDRRGVIRAVAFGGPQSAATIASQVDGLLREAP
jgi:cytochrome c biogenesis protein CcmG/thiol:disulfide interchange protein DsbE